jgi:hypothetical protein
MNFKLINKYLSLFINWPNIASGKSNGGLFVSANIAIKNIKAIGNNGKTFHTACWHSTIYVKLKELENIINIKIIEENTNSYDNNCAVDLIAPINAYFELAAQPLINIP